MSSLKNFDKAQSPVAVITGGGKRLGCVIAKSLHELGYYLLIHYRHSHQDAQALCASLNAERPDSVQIVQADFDEFAQISRPIDMALTTWGRLDVLINNASSFFPTQVGDTTQQQWHQLMSSNLQAPYFLVQAAKEALTSSQGCVINIADIHGQRPLKGYAVYSTAKGGLIMLTQALARELAPRVRVNAIAPGITLWADELAQCEDRQQALIDRTLLKKIADPQDIVRGVVFLMQQRSMTGQVITMDCGRILAG